MCVTTNKMYPPNAPVQYVRTLYHKDNPLFDNQVANSATKIGIYIYALIIH